jgi:hypothetical protein
MQGSNPMNRSRLFALLLLAFSFISRSAIAADDAEILSTRVPDQEYYVADSCAYLQRGKTLWVIPVWACDPASLTIIKVLGGSAPAPYAIKITPKGRNPINALGTLGQRWSIHLLAASLEDAVKMRRALVIERDKMQRRIEARQGNAPGYLKRVLDSKKHQ